MKRNFPNLFIIGAPKCGTTSLAYWLSKHPEVYFFVGESVDAKLEPHFWASDLKLPFKMTQTEYYSLFSNFINKDKVKYAGEASPAYLYSNVAVKNIEANIYKPKYIVSIRNPVDMAFSLWLQSIVNGSELCVTDFMKAFKLSDLRFEGKPVFWDDELYDPRLGAYFQICSLGSQLENLFKVVPRERVLVLVLDDISANPQKEWLKIINFLNIEDYKIDFKIYNKRKNISVENILLYKIYSYITKVAVKTRKLRRKIGLINTGFLVYIMNLFFNQKNITMDYNTRKILIDCFKPEIKKLEEILERKFDKWME